MRSVAFSPDGTQLATGHDRGAILIWDVATGHLVRRLGELEAGDGGTCDELAHASWHDESNETSSLARAANPTLPGSIASRIVRTSISWASISSSAGDRAR